MLVSNIQLQLEPSSLLQLCPSLPVETCPNYSHFNLHNILGVLGMNHSVRSHSVHAQAQDAQKPYKLTRSFLVICELIHFPSNSLLFNQQKYITLQKVPPYHMTLFRVGHLHYVIFPFALLYTYGRSQTTNKSAETNLCKNQYKFKV